MSQQQLSVVSWNLNGIKGKMKTLKKQIETHNVAFLQETRTGPGSANILETLTGWKAFFTKHSSKVKGVAILVKEDIFEQKYVFEDPAGCYVVVKCKLKDELYTLVSVYNHQKDTRPLENLRYILENHAEGALLIGGDFNLALNPYLDKTSSKKNNHHFMLKPIVDKFLTSFHLVDVWRRLHPITQQYSYKQNNVQSRLDYVFVPEESVHLIDTCEIIQENCSSDHQPVVFTVKSGQSRCKKQIQTLKISEEKRTRLSEFMSDVSEKWLDQKEKLWKVKIRGPIDPKEAMLVGLMDIETAIQSLAVNKHSEDARPDGVPVSFYEKYSYVLMPYLRVFYHRLLTGSLPISEDFTNTISVNKHRMFNVDYLILTSIMAKWLREHLECQSNDYSGEKDQNPVLFAFKKGPKMVRWSALKGYFEKEREANPPLHTKLNYNLLEKILINHPRKNVKLLSWGCPLTPVLMTLCLKHVAERFVESLSIPNSTIHIYGNCVIVCASQKIDMEFLKKSEQELPTIYCRAICKTTETP